MTTKPAKARILLYDIETAPLQVNTWSLYQDGISHDNIINEWYLICAAWKYEGEKKVSSVQISKPGDDYEVVKRLAEEIAKADILVGHNSKKFDTKKLNARLIYHKLPPLPDVVQVDTLREAKKIASFTSNRLDYLCKFFTGKGKIHTSYNLWLDVIAGSKRALKDMVTYNKRDVVCLEEVYLHLRPYMKTHPHVGLLENSNKETCPKCGGKTKRNGTRITAGGMKKQELQCTSCGGYHTTSIPKA